MANAEAEKLNLLREHRSSKERFYYNLTILTGGTLTVVVTFVSNMKEAIDALGYCSISLLHISIYFLLVSLLLFILRNYFASKLIKNIVLDEKITEYKKVIEESVKEKWYISLFSTLSIVLFIIGLTMFSLIAERNFL